MCWTRMMGRGTRWRLWGNGLPAACGLGGSEDGQGEIPKARHNVSDVAVENIAIPEDEVAPVGDPCETEYLEQLLSVFRPEVAGLETTSTRVLIAEQIRPVDATGQVESRDRIRYSAHVREMGDREAGTRIAQPEPAFLQDPATILEVGVDLSAVFRQRQHLLRKGQRFKWQSLNADVERLVDLARQVRSKIAPQLSDIGDDVRDPDDRERPPDSVEA